MKNFKNNYTLLKIQRDILSCLIENINNKRFYTLWNIIEYFYYESRVKELIIIITVSETLIRDISSYRINLLWRFQPFDN